MTALESLDAHVMSRAAELEKMKAAGRKVVGYWPGGYVPEEIILACDAIPVGLHRGGERDPVLVAGAYLPRWFCTFCRAQVGYKAMKGEPYYDLADITVVPIVDNCVLAVADCWEFYKMASVFRFGVPHRKTKEALDYYLHGIKSLREAVEAFTGVKITDEKLREAIILCNKERELLRKISLMRKADPPPLTGAEFVRINHASLLADKQFMVETLESIYNELSKREIAAPKGPRILLAGSTLAYGDSKVLSLVEEAGGNVVIEHFDEGLRYYWNSVEPDGDPMAALAKAYYQERIGPAWFRPWTDGMDFIVNLAKEFNVNGVIWYYLMYRDSHVIQAALLSKVIEKATGISMLKIESDYDAAELGPLRTRVETYLEIARR